MKSQKIDKISIGKRYEINSDRQEINSIRYKIKWKLQNPKEINKKSLGNQKHSTRNQEHSIRKQKCGLQKIDKKSTGNRHEINRIRRKNNNILYEINGNH